MCRGWGCTKKDRSCSAFSRGFLLKDRKKRLFCLKVLVCCYQACNVLQLLIGTINVTAPCFSFLSLFLCSKPLRLQPETQQGKQGHVPPNVTPSCPKAQLGTHPGAVMGVQRWLNDRLCPVPTASLVPVFCIQPRNWDASNLSQMPNEPQVKKRKKKKERAAAKSDTEVFQQKPLLPNQLKEPPLLLSAPGRLSWNEPAEISQEHLRKICGCWRAKGAMPHLGIWPLAKQKFGH